MPGESTSAEVDAIAAELMRAADDADLIEPVSNRYPGFDSAVAYDVLSCIAERRRQRGWVAAGRKLGFTNRTIWPLYGVETPMWAHVWDRTVRVGTTSTVLPLSGLVQPRIEPEVVFRIRGPVTVTDDPSLVLEAVDAVAAGFEIVQCHFPDWKFTLPDCTAAFGLHGALVVGPWVAVRDGDRAGLAERLTSFEAVLTRDGDEVDRGIGENVLGSPAHALCHLVRLLASQPDSDDLATGEVVTTGTITNAWPVLPGETWTCDYGSLDLPRVRLTFS